MVKNSELKKSDLMKILNTSTSSKEINKAVKLLKKFEPIFKKHLDSTFETRHIRIKKHQLLQAFVCWRCDKVKQTNIKVQWNTSEGVKTICNTCYSNLCTMKDLERARKENNEYNNADRKTS